MWTLAPHVGAAACVLYVSFRLAFTHLVQECETMRNLLPLTVLTLAASVAAHALAGDWNFDQLKLGVTTPDELRAAFPESRTEIPKGDGQIVVHFQDANGTKGVCRFVRERLYKYTVTLPAESRGVAAAGGWDEMIEAGKVTFGQPKSISADAVTWDLEKIHFNLNRRPPEFITVTLCDKKLEELTNSAAAQFPSEPTVANEVVHGGPYYLNGSRPGQTRRVKLTQGVYLLEARHEGDGNFIVYLYSPTDHELVANEIDNSRACTTIHVEEPVEEVFFIVKRAGGPWEISLKKMPGVAP
jgi:hypothetical protein